MNLKVTIMKIERYFESTSHYPLIVVVQPAEYKELIDVFSNIEKIKVSDYCVGDDKEPDTEKLQEDVMQKTGKFLLIGLGDYLANKINIAKKTLLPYKDMYLKKDCHVAIILSSYMYSTVKEIYKADPRVRTRIIFPTSVPESIEVDNNRLVYGIRAYLEACEKGESVGCVKSARSIQTVNVINPDNAFDELKLKFPNEFSTFSKNAGTKDNWSELLKNLNINKMNIKQYLETQNFVSPEYTFLHYSKKNDYIAWLYFIHLKINMSINTYLGLVASKATKLSDLLGIAKTAILDFTVSDKQFSKYYDQRKILLKNCEDVDMADYIPKIAVCGSERIAYLTDNTKIEKQAVIVSLCEGANVSHIPRSFSDLNLYLQDYLFEDQRFTDYFSSYKKCKLKNRIDEDFLDVVAEYAISRPYNSLPARSSLLSTLDNHNTVLLFLDALGAEYLGYVKGKCAELKLHFSSKLARADLPTITSVNKGFFDEWNGKKETPIKDLDELKHHPERGYDHNNSPYPIHLVEELDVIKIALERAKVKLSNGECRKVLIVSDHGASRLAVISPDVQVSSKSCEAKSNGRYCYGEDLPSANNIVTEAENKYAVIADYSRFTGSRAASVEMHGGATLEEVIVPIIEITLVENYFEVILLDNIIEVSYNTIPKLRMMIMPDCENITVAVGKSFYEVLKLEKNKYEILMPELKKGKYTLDIFENQNKIVSKEFTIKSKGFTERDMF